MSRHTITLTTRRGTEHEIVFSPNAHGPGVFVAAYPRRGVLPEEEVRALADWLHDAADAQEEARRGAST